MYINCNRNLGIYTNDFYRSLGGVLGMLVKISPVTLVISAILYIISAISVVKAVKYKYE